MVLSFCVPLSTLTTLVTLARNLNLYCHIPLIEKFAIGLQNKKFKENESGQKINKLTSALSLDYRGDWSRFIMMFMEFCLDGTFSAYNITSVQEVLVSRQSSQNKKKMVLYISEF